MEITNKKVKIEDLFLPSTFISRIKDTDLIGNAENLIKDPLYLQAFIEPNCIKLRANCSKNDYGPTNDNYPSLSVYAGIPNLIDCYDNFKTHKIFPELVSALALEDAQITGYGKENCSDQWLAFWGVDHQRKVWGCQKPFLVDNVTPEQMHQMLKVVEKYYSQHLEEFQSKAILRYTVEFSWEREQKTIINVLEGRSWYIRRDIDYFRPGETYEDLTVLVKVGHADLFTKEKIRSLYASWVDRHPPVRLGCEMPSTKGFDTVAIMMSKEGFFELAK